MNFFGSLFARKKSDKEILKGQQKMFDVMQLMNDNKSKGGKITFKNEGDDSADIYIYDAIGGWWGLSPQEFAEKLDDITAGTINVYLNCPGGSVFDARAMKIALERHKAKVIFHIDGLAASAATFLMMAGDEIIMNKGSYVMIHNAWSYAVGTADDLRDTADLLDRLGDDIVADYREKTGQSAKKLKQWMKDETWFNADEALKHGFVDEIYSKKDDEETDAENSISFNLGAYGNVPQSLIEDMKKPANQNLDDEIDNSLALAKARMQLVNTRTA